MADSDSSPPLPKAAPLSLQKKENIPPIGTKIADLQSWRSKLDTQVKTYRDELSELKKSLNVEVDQLRSEFQELRTTLQQQQDDVSSSLRTLGLQDVSGDPKDAQAQDPKVEDNQDGLVLPRQMDYDVSGDAKDAQAQDPKVEEDDKEELVLPKKLEYDEGSEN
ncbi:hypothetical protein RGQ29_023769 [Quercus rubra]|uniref:CAP-Gly domain-containing linker protein 1 n=1 Tax=Quercus rubra TaxID=3512 RepID=A0AAN7F6W4_QUERU|nr:hypothetical protein RGQ29_023769 [Quercus rubra]